MQNDYTSRASLPSLLDDPYDNASAASQSMRASSCLTHLMAYFGSPVAACAPCAPCDPASRGPGAGDAAAEDDVAARMRRSMSSRVLE